MISLLLTLLFFAIAAAAWAIMSHYSHHAFVPNKTSFFGKESWVRKYKQSADGSLVAAPKNLYYRIFKLDYREKFPLSATLFVFVTDYWHFFQWIMVSSLCAALSGSLYGFAILWALWHLVFTIVYLILKKDAN